MPTLEKRGRGRPRKADLKPSKQELARYAAPPPALSDTQAMINAITAASRDPAVDIAKMDWLLKTRTTILEDEARVEYNSAMARVQAALEPVRRAALNPQTSSKYATEAALDEAIRPEYSREGFALEFDTEAIPDRDDRWVMVVCYCSRGRERRRHQIPMPCDGLGRKGAPVMTRTHATGSAFSYGRRYLRCGIFNVITADMAKHDDDGNRAGRYEEPPHDARTGEIKEPEKATVAEIAVLRAIMKRAGVEESVVLNVFELDRLEDMTKTECAQAVKKCNKNLQQATDNMHASSNREAQSG